MINLKAEIKKNKLLVAILSNQNYNDTLLEIAKSVSGNKITCYVGLNKPYSTTNDNLKAAKVNTSKFLFVDAITKGAGRKTTDNVIFVSSPRALTELNISINKILETGKVGNLVFDSLSTLLIYEKPLTVVKFVHSLTAKLRALNLSTVFIVLKDDVTPDLLKNLYMFADKVLDLSQK